MRDLDEEIAPDGQVFMCGACGKHNKHRIKVGDESCWMHAVLVYEDSITRTDKGRVTGAKAVSK